MNNRTSLLAAAPFVSALFAFAAPVLAQSEPPRRFPVASVRFEQNATDGDVEVVFEVAGRSEGLTKLSILGPDGRKVVDFESDKSTLGLRQFVFESPEPKNVAGLKAAYPEGVYRFEGATASGAALRGEAKLRHNLPATTDFVAPKADASGVPVRDLTITWTPVSGMAAYIVELEQEDTEVALSTRLPASKAEFVVPNDFLIAGTEYKLGIGTVGTDGNISYVEMSFTTAP